MALQPEQTATTAQPIERIAAGQKLMIYAILVYLLSFAVGLNVNGAFGGIALLTGSIIAIGMSLVGAFRVASGLGYSNIAKIVIFILLFWPGIRIITLLVLNSRATKALREVGYKVGLLGARR